jgi:sugar phosphate isomerase/epimerase
MNAVSVERWRVYQELEPIAFEEWAGSVDRVVRLRARLERPNPDYKGREKVKELVDGANARMTEIAWTADPESPDGIDTRDEVIREAIEHTRKYGRARAVGERQGLPSLWDSGQEGVAEQRVLVTDPKTREVDPEDLRRELGDQSEEA